MKQMQKVMATVYLEWVSTAGLQALRMSHQL